MEGELVGTGSFTVDSKRWERLVDADIKKGNMSLDNQYLSIQLGLINAGLDPDEEGDDICG